MDERIQDGSQPLKSINQEAFVNHILAGVNQRRAYKKAYPKQKSKDEVVDCNASVLIRKTKVAARLTYKRALLERKVGKEVKYTRIDAIKEYEEARELAIECKQAGACSTAVAGKVALCGLAVKEAENPVDKKPLTRVELEQALAELDEIDREANIIQMQVNARTGAN